MSDPFAWLHSLSDDGVPVTPPPAHLVRRRGDQIRRRRTALGAVGVCAAVAMLASGGILVTQDMTSTSPPPGPVTQGPSPVRSSAPAKATESPAPAPPAGWLTRIPRYLPLQVGLPEEGGDVPEWQRSEDVAMPWQQLPCPTEEASFETTIAQDSQRTDARTIIVEPPAAAQSRQLVVFADEATAIEAVDSIHDIATTCGPVTAVPGITEFRYQVRQVTFGNTPGFVIAGGEYVADNGSRAPSRSLSSVVRVGNAVFVGGLSDESDADPLHLKEPGAATLKRATGQIVQAMCVFAADPCPRPSPTPEFPRTSTPAQPRPSDPGEPSPTQPQKPNPSEPDITSPFEPQKTQPQPSPEPVLNAANLVTAADLPALDDEGPWRAIEPQPVPTLSCQADWLSSLGAAEQVYREFRVPPHPRADYSTAAIHTAVLAFDSRTEASAAYSTVRTWVQDCRRRVDNSRPVAYNGERPVHPTINEAVASGASSISTPPTCARSATRSGSTVKAWSRSDSGSCSCPLPSSEVLSNPKD